MAKEKKAKKEGKARITTETTLGDVVTKYPRAAEVMLKHGMHCIGCHMAAWETVGQGCASHGMNKKDIERLLKEMNEAASE